MNTSNFKLDVIAWCDKYHDNMLCLGDVNVKGHHLGQGGVLTGQQAPWLFLDFQPPLNLRLVASHLYLWNSPERNVI